MPGLIVLGNELTLDDMHDLGWGETAQSIGLQADVSFVVALNTDDDYGVTRHLRSSSYERLTNTNFRGAERAVVITVWNN